MDRPLKSEQRPINLHQRWPPEERAWLKAEARRIGASETDLLIAMVRREALGGERDIARLDAHLPPPSPRSEPARRMRRAALPPPRSPGDRAREWRPALRLPEWGQEPTQPETARGDAEQAVQGAEPPLSTRQRQVLELLALGHVDKEIAAVLGVNLASIRTYRKRIAEKLGVRGPGPTLLVAWRLKQINLEALAQEAMAQRTPSGPEPRTPPEGLVSP